MRNADLDGTNIGIQINGRTIINIRYADDTTLIADCEEDMKELIKRVKEASQNAGLYLNIKKTKIMSTVDISDFEVDGETIEAS